jgi:hypothetical protein
MKKYKFNIEKYNFRKIIEDYFSTCDLENINDLEINIEKGEDCLTTKYHQIYLYWFNNDDRFKILYDDFIHEYVSKLFNEKILYEKVPKIRIHYQNNYSVLDFHKDKEYLVGNSNLKSLFATEINFWMPLTNAYDTNTMWVESEEDKGDYTPVNSTYGDLIQFDGANLSHGNKKNITNQTRVSIDFRLQMESNYLKSLPSLSPKEIKMVNRYYDFIDNLNAFYI